MASAREQPRCLRCHRQLKNPKACIRGFGPVCYARLLVDFEYRGHPQSSIPIIPYGQPPLFPEYRYETS